MPPKPPQPWSTTTAGRSAVPALRQSAARTVCRRLEKSARWQYGAMLGNFGGVRGVERAPRAAPATAAAHASATITLVQALRGGMRSHSVTAPCDRCDGGVAWRG